jgi:hypothetical protein
VEVLRKVLSERMKEMRSQKKKKTKKKKKKKKKSTKSNQNLEGERHFSTATTKPCNAHMHQGTQTTTHPPQYDMDGHHHTP